MPSPLVGCLRLQRVLRGIKRHQGSNKCQCQPITIELMHIISQSLNFSDHNHTMHWAACFLGFFGFLSTGVFSVSSHFNSDIHLTVSDIQADSLVNPGNFRMYIKCFKTDPFHQGCYIYIGAVKRDLCPVRTLTQYPWLDSWPTLPSLRWHPSKSPMAIIQYSIHALRCWGPGLLHQS